MSENGSTEVALLPAALTPAIVFANGGVDDVLKAVREAVKDVPRDISTEKNRAVIKSAAYKVARSKTALDEMGKELTAELKAKTGKIDADRKRIRDELDALKDEIRKPLTDWEMAEEKRVADHESALEYIRSRAVFETSEPTIELIESRIVEVSASASRDWQEFSMRANAVVELAMLSLSKLRDATIKRNEERAELLRLQAEEAARKQAEREAEIARQAAEQARLKAEQIAAEAMQKEQAERARAEREKIEAQQRAERAEADRIEAERIANQRALEAAAKAEADKLAAIEAERARVAAEQKRIADEEAARERDKKHKATVNNAVVAALVASAHIDEIAAKAVVVAIAKGEIPNVKISY